MNRVPAIIIVTLMLVLVAACRRNDIRTHCIVVPDMTNEVSMNRVELALKSLPGVAEITFSNTSAIVTYDSMQVAHRNMEYAIADAGFQANDIPPSVDGKRIPGTTTKPKDHK